MNPTSPANKQEAGVAGPEVLGEPTESLRANFLQYDLLRSLLEIERKAWPTLRWEEGRGWFSRAFTIHAPSVRVLDDVCSDISFVLGIERPASITAATALEKAS